MWQLNGSNDLEAYFKIIEQEAQESRQQKDTCPSYIKPYTKPLSQGPELKSNHQSNPSVVFYSNYSKNLGAQNGNNAGGDFYQSSNQSVNSCQPANGRNDLYQLPSNYGGVSKEPPQQVEVQHVAASAATQDSVIPDDPDGYKRIDFNRCLFSYTDSQVSIRHIFLTIFQREDLMEYTTKILECTTQDKIVLSIQRDNQLAEAFAAQLRIKGFWSTEITNQTVEPEKLAGQHSVYRCIVTTMAFLRDNPDLFKRPTVIMNFDHVVNHVKYLERWIHYRASINPPMDANETFIYEMCFQSSVTSQALKEYIQSKYSHN